MAVQFLRKMVGISFLLGTLALTWYASTMYRIMRCGIHHHDKQKHGQQEMPPQPLWDASTTAVYGLGTLWWILTCFLVYLVPLVMKRGNKQRNTSTAAVVATSTTNQSHKNSDCSRRIIFWFLVVAPSLWVFLYGTSVGWVGARARIKGEPDDGDTDTTTVMEWVEILILASALPSGTAGMMSMGIYVFGTVAKHSPLWSAYVVLPGNNNNGNTNGHANLMKDALRLHQWAGYVTFAWFVLHTILYCFIYGLAGVMHHFAEASEHINDINNATANTTGAIANTTNTTEDDSSPSTTLIFFASMWKALVPPKECRPILGFWGSSDSQNNTTNSSHAKHTKHGRRQLYRVLFEEELPESGQEEASYALIANYTANSSAFPPSEEELPSVNHAKNTVSTTNPSVTANTGGSSKFSIGMGLGKGHGKGHGNQSNSTNEEQQQQQQKDKGRQCYGYYRNFNGFIAILAILVLVLTSLTFVRRKNYRFFYVSHIVTAIIFLVTMILHMKRIIVYLMPSLVLYFATTIPSWIESLAGAIFDGGVNVQDCTVLNSKNSQYYDGNGDSDDGVAEISFWVVTDAGEAKEVVTKNNQEISYRPKSVRICVPSISLIWYPFTVIEPSEASTGTTNAKSNLVKYKVIFGTVGYFTKSLWKRLYELEQIERDYEWEGDEEGLTERDELFDDEDIPGENGGSIEKQQKHFSVRRNSHKHHKKSPPLILMDGFYSGAADWVENARQHDSVLIAAGGTGVTPFLTFVPKLLRLLQEGGENCGLVVSFLWCCRDEALIEHVVTTYLLPLFQTGIEQDEHRHTNNSTQSARLRLMIYNTSRDRSNSDVIELAPKQKLSDKSTFLSRGVPMKPSRLQHHPYSSRTRVVAGILAFLSIASAGVGIHLWADKIVHANRHMFSVRLYGLLAIVAWTIVVGILTEATWRCWSGWGMQHTKKGYSIANKNDHGSSLSQNSDFHSQVSNGDDETIETTENASLEKANPHQIPTSLELGRIYSGKCSESQTNLNSLLELSISIGRPILKYETEYGVEDDGNERGDCGLSPSEATLKDMVEADRPGVFYCGPQSLMEAIKSRVDTGRDSRRRLGGGASAVSDCVYYEESFEM